MNKKFVFVGGATLPFYLPAAYQSQARPTEDVDVVMEIPRQPKEITHVVGQKEQK